MPKIVFPTPTHEGFAFDVSPTKKMVWANGSWSQKLNTYTPGNSQSVSQLPVLSETAPALPSDHAFWQKTSTGDLYFQQTIGSVTDWALLTTTDNHMFTFVTESHPVSGGAAPIDHTPVNNLVWDGVLRKGASVKNVELTVSGSQVLLHAADIAGSTGATLTFKYAYNTTSNQLETLLTKMTAATPSAGGLQTGDVIQSMRPINDMVAENFVQTGSIASQTTYPNLSTVIGSIPDGYNVEAATTVSEVTGILTDVVEGNGVLVAVGRSVDSVCVVLRSTDQGVNWTEVTIPTIAAPGKVGVTFGNGIFMLAFAKPEDVTTEPSDLVIGSSIDNGVTWSFSTSVVTKDMGFRDFQAIEFGNDQFVIVGLGYTIENYPYTRPMCISSGDNGGQWALTWINDITTNTGDPAEVSQCHLAFSAGTFVLSYLLGDSSIPNTWRSTGSYGSTWDTIPSGEVPTVFTGQPLVGLSDTTPQHVVYSTDGGTSWVQTAALPTFTEWSTVMSGDGAFIVMSGNDVCVSHDNGQTWVEGTLPVNVGNADSHNTTFSGNKGIVLSQSGQFWPISKTKVMVTNLRTYNPTTEFYIPSSGVQLTPGVREWVKA